MFGEFPILRIDAVFYFWGFDGTLYQTGLFQLAQMLRHCSFCNRKDLVDISEETFVSLSEKMQDCYPSGMTHCLCKSRKPFLIRCYL